MKISAYHKARGDNVEWYNPLYRYDRVYMGKVFSFTPDYGSFINADRIEKGGTGSDISKNLPKEIDWCYPDYSLYGVENEAYEQAAFFQSMRTYKRLYKYFKVAKYPFKEIKPV